MYDLNGLELTQVADSLNSYKLTAVDTKIRKISAYAASRPNHKNDFSMHTIGQYNDPRDAAYVGQEFAKRYDKVTVKQMVIDGTFRAVANEFRESIEIPEWKFRAEGLDFDDIFGGKYEKNYMDNSRDALLEAIRVLGKKTPALPEAKKLMAEVDKLVNAGGITFRQAAHKLVGDLP